nr:unnamed protein product [Spirometra erinaceieuropaei]
MDDERLPEQFFYGDVAAGSRRQEGQVRSHKGALQTPEAPTDQSDKLGRPRPGPTCVEENNKDRFSCLRRQLHHPRQSQMRYTQFSNAAAASQRQRPTISNVPSMLTDIPDAKWTCCKSPEQPQHPDYISCCFLVQLCLILHADN